MPLFENCIFCFEDPTQGTVGVEPERILEGFDHWWLVLQSEAKRKKTRQAAGLLVAKRHFSVMSEATHEETAELILVTQKSAETLCSAVGTTYTESHTFGFDEGLEAGPGVGHAHAHILPVSVEDSANLARLGIGRVFQVLHEQRFD